MSQVGPNQILVSPVVRDEDGGFILQPDNRIMVTIRKSHGQYTGKWAGQEAELYGFDGQSGHFLCRICRLVNRGNVIKDRWMRSKFPIERLTLNKVEDWPRVWSMLPEGEYRDKVIAAAVADRLQEKPVLGEVKFNMLQHLAQMTGRTIRPDKYPSFNQTLLKKVLDEGINKDWDGTVKTVSNIHDQILIEVTDEQPTDDPYSDEYDADPIE